MKLWSKVISYRSLPLLLFFIQTFFGSTAYLTHASGVYVWQVEIGCVQSGEFPVWITLVIRVVIAISILSVFAKVGLASYQYLFAGGTDKTLTETKQSAVRTFSGLVTLVLSSLFLQIVNPDILGDDLVVDTACTNII
jgi:hypothetical protein